MKTTKKMRGFMCHSTAATAVCMASSGDPARSVVVPRRPDRILIGNTRLTNTAQYSRLVNVQANERSILVPSFKGEQDLQYKEPKSKSKPKPLAKLHDPLASVDQVFQVVVMRVSLHCQGCAGKVKKHLSKMEGVTSFSIDLEMKRVTVMGHVSPAGVVESVSKIKKAELWPC